MINISNNSFSTRFLSTAILFIPGCILLWIIVLGHITVVQKIIVFLFFIGILLANFWLNFLIYNIYYNAQLKQIIIKQLGRVVYESTSHDIDIKPMGIYGMSVANFIFIIDGKSFRFRSNLIRFGLSDWINRNAAAKKLKADITNRIV